MAENETPAALPDPFDGQAPSEALTPPEPLADPYEGQSPAEAMSPEAMMRQAAEAGRLADLVRSNPAEAAKHGVGAAGMRREPPPEPEPLSKSIHGEINLSHVVDGIGRLEDQNRQIMELLRNQGGAKF